MPEGHKRCHHGARQEGHRRNLRAWLRAWLLSWWGAGLSTLLAIVKLSELWRDRFRVVVGYKFTSQAEIGNDILIRNLSSRPLILGHWELLYCSGYWPKRIFDEIESADLEFTEYKKAVLNVVSSAFAVEQVSRVGELELVVQDGTTVECDLVLMPDWKTDLPKRTKAKSV